MNIALIVFFLTFVVVFVLRMPIGIGMMVSSVFYFALSTNPAATVDMVATQFLSNMNSSFILIAVPLFVFMAEIMNSGKVTSMIFSFANALVGKKKGALGHVNVVASIIFSGMTGSALADASGLGSMEIKAMKEHGYDDGYTCAITAASATIGPIIPPSIPFVIYASMAQVSVGGLFLAGVGPGLLLCLTLCVYIFFIVKKRNYPKNKRSTAKEIFISFWRALPALLFPAVLLGSIWGGFCTPTEAALIAIVYGLIVSCVIYRDMKIAELPKLLLVTARQIGPSIAVVVAASLFSWILTYEKVDKALVDVILSITRNKYVILLLINILLLFLGMFVEVVAAIMITLPILTPLMAIAHIDPVHMGVILTLNMMIGLLTPPVGFSLYMLSTISGHPFNKIVKMVAPWWIPLMLTLLLVTYIEPITMWLPRIVGLVK